MNLEQAQAFVEANKIEITDKNKLSRCVDGRYDNIYDCPMIAKPGGDAGDVMSMFGALNILGKTLPNKDVFNLVMENIGGVKNFNFHTDEHADQGVAGLGCGHLKQAKLDPSAYGVTQDQMDFIFNDLPKTLHEGANQEVLYGNHEERAVIVVDSTNYGVIPVHRDGEKVSQAFIYQKTLHEDQLDNLAKALQEALAGDGTVVEETEVRDALDGAFAKQLGETLKRLAEGLPVYVAKISDNGEVEISQ